MVEEVTEEVEEEVKVAMTRTKIPPSLKRNLERIKTEKNTKLKFYLSKCETKNE